MSHADARTRRRCQAALDAASRAARRTGQVYFVFAHSFPLGALVQPHGGSPGRMRAIDNSRRYRRTRFCVTTMPGRAMYRHEKWLCTVDPTMTRARLRQICI